jgi:hypothetical protein
MLNIQRSKIINGTSTQLLILGSDKFEVEAWLNYFHNYGATTVEPEKIEQRSDGLWSVRFIAKVNKVLHAFAMSYAWKNEEILSLYKGQQGGVADVKANAQARFDALPLCDVYFEEQADPSSWELEQAQTGGSCRSYSTMD